MCVLFLNKINTPLCSMHISQGTYVCTEVVCMNDHSRTVGTVCIPPFHIYNPLINSSLLQHLLQDFHLLRSRLLGAHLLLLVVQIIHMLHSLNLVTKMYWQPIQYSVLWIKHQCMNSWMRTSSHRKRLETLPLDDTSLVDVQTLLDYVQLDKTERERETRRRKKSVDSSKIKM